MRLREPDRSDQHRHVTGLIKGVSEHFPNAQVTFDKFHVIAHASAAIDETRRLEQKIDPSIKGLRWALLKDRRSEIATGSAAFSGSRSQN